MLSFWRPVSLSDQQLNGFWPFSLPGALSPGLPAFSSTIKRGRTCHSSFQDLAHLKMSLLFPLFTQKLVGHINADKNTCSQNFEGTAPLFSTSLLSLCIWLYFFFLCSTCHHPTDSMFQTCICLYFISPAQVLSTLVPAVSPAPSTESNSQQHSTKPS